MLEIGAGTGAGFAFYAPGTQVAAIEPSIVMAARARIRAVALRGASRHGHLPGIKGRRRAAAGRGARPGRAPRLRRAPALAGGRRTRPAVRTRRRSS